MRLCIVLFPGILLAACGGSSVNLWPFGESGPRDMGRRPANATEYQCAGGKQFYVRNLEAGAVWLIAPDREIRLEKPAGEPNQVYAAGRVRLELGEQTATLLDPPAQFLGCQRAK